jgi:hypothetical protein
MPALVNQPIASWSAYAKAENGKIGYTLIGTLPKEHRGSGMANRKLMVVVLCALLFVASAALVILSK